VVVPHAERARIRLRSSFGGVYLRREGGVGRGRGVGSVASAGGPGASISLDESAGADGVFSIEVGALHPRRGSVRLRGLGHLPRVRGREEGGSMPAL